MNLRAVILETDERGRLSLTFELSRPATVELMVEEEEVYLRVVPRNNRLTDLVEQVMEAAREKRRKAS